ncbi:MAG: thrombospondin type 3 repeat-containing protein [Planctomycetota bacterium]|jgi:hypothetical protein
MTRQTTKLAAGLALLSGGPALACDLAVLAASDQTAADRFGTAIAAAGDVVVVGASGHDAGGLADAGAAYVYHRQGSVWLEQQKLTADEGSVDAQFGGAVAASGNVVLAGARWHDGPGLNNAGAAYVFRFDGATWGQEQKLLSADLASFDGFGFSLAVDGDVAVVGAPFDSHGGGGAAGSAYVFRFDGMTWVQEQKLVATDAFFQDQFGTSVDVSGDVIVVGAHQDDDACPGDSQCDSGSGYVFRFDGMTWVQEQKLTAADAEEEDRFGQSVSISGDLILVGAFNDDDSEAIAPDGFGSAYVFSFDGADWIEDQKLTASDATLGDAFGISVSIEGSTVLVGADRDDDAGGNSGAAYLFRPQDGTWLETRKLGAADGTGGDRFGGAVALNGGLALAGASLNDDACPGDVFCDSGSAYVFQVDGADDDGDGIPDDCDNCLGVANADQADADGDGIGNACEDDDDDDGVPDGSDNCPTVPNPDQADDNGNGLGDACEIIGCELQKLVASDADALDRFGEQLSVRGDVAIVGAWNDETVGVPGFSIGSAYVFRRQGDVWLEEQKLVASDPDSGDRFGHDVAVDGDVAIVSAVGADDACPGTDCASGAAYMFRFVGASWIEEQKLLATPPAAADEFGFAVAVSGPVAVVGTPRDDEACGGAATCDTGAVYVFRYDGEAWVLEQKLTAPDAAPQDYFGYAVAVSGDTIFVGARVDDDGGTSTGSVYVYRHNGASWVERPKLHAADAQEFDLFGHSIALDGDLALIGALGDDDACPGDALCNSGSAYVFRFDGAAWAQEQKLTASDGAADDEYGHDVSINGDLALVGARWDDEACPEDPDCDSGSAYLYRFDGASWVEAAKLVASDGAPVDFYGNGVGVSDGFALVGSHVDDDAGTGSGSAYVYGGWAEICTPPCPEDLDGDGTVGITDFLVLLAQWGTDPGGPPDFDGDGTVGITDFLVLLANWGPCT